jgi:hypothetical protein
VAVGHRLLGREVRGRWTLRLRGAPVAGLLPLVSRTADVPAGAIDALTARVQSIVPELLLDPL